MTKRMFLIRTVLSSSIMAIAVVFAPKALAQVGDLPNLTPLPASDIALVGTRLNFSTTSWNRGLGPLELVAGQGDTGSGKQRVDQHVYLSDGTSFDHFAGWMQWHQTHNHFHFDGYALYTLQPVNAPGGSQRTGSKTTFCVMDTDKIDGSLPGAPTNPVYSTCGTQIQGMSVGWGDKYGSGLRDRASISPATPMGSIASRSRSIRISCFSRPTRTTTCPVSYWISRVLV